MGSFGTAGEAGEAMMTGARVAMAELSESNDKAVCDGYGRRLEYVRLAVTDRCNMRCFYCLPNGSRDPGVPACWLTADEIEQVMSAFAALGVSRIRLTGGEPLARKGLAELAARLAAIPGIDDLSLSTNGLLLAKQALRLRRAGVARLNVSLDSLQPERFRRITGGRLGKVLDGLMAAKAAGFAPIKINVLAMRGVNDDEFEALVEFCARHGFTLRFIETMPVGGAGAGVAVSHFLDLREVQEMLRARFDLVPAMMPGGGPARYFKISGTDLTLGFITPLSQHFCDSCNRVRLAPDGVLYLCLGHEHKVELRPLLRSGVSTERLCEILRDALALKPRRHQFEAGLAPLARTMAATGG